MGNTHLAVALAKRAIERGYGAYFARAYDLMEDLRVKGVDKTYQWGGAKVYHQRGHWPA